MPGIIVRPRARILHGHDWVYATEVLKTYGDPPDGSTISIKDGKDRLLGTGIYNAKSQIVARRISRHRQKLDAKFFEYRIAQAIAHRDAAGCSPTLRRLVWSESDGLPGVIADQYGSTIVLQTLTLAMDQHKSCLAETLLAATGATGVLERNDASVRTLEGLPLQSGTLAGSPQTQVALEIEGVSFEIDLQAGQKTGFYLDQITNYHLVAKHAKNRRVLDCFANQGGFALACARQGATSVTAVESGAESFARLEANAKRNKLSLNANRADVFDFLKQAERNQESYDLIILDPPSFTKAKGRVQDAVRGYRDLHLRAAKLLNRGGLLATFSCSHHISADIFLDAIRAGFEDARQNAHLVTSFSQSPDHPILLTMPETAYLKGFLLLKKSF